MSTGIELTMHNQLVLGEPTDMVKPDLKTVKSLSTHTQQPQNPLDKQQHPLHQFDLTVMSKFYSACVEKLREQNPKFKPTEWATKNPMPTHLTWEQKKRLDQSIRVQPQTTCL